MELITNSVVPDRWRHTRVPPTGAELPVPAPDNRAGDLPPAYLADFVSRFNAAGREAAVKAALKGPEPRKGKGA